MLNVIALVTGFSGLAATLDETPSETAMPPAPPDVVAAITVDLAHKPDPDALLVHFVCDEMSRARLLAPGMVQMCSRTFLSIKMGFVPDMTLQRYRALPAPEKARANRISYAAWRTWVDANGPQVETYARKARRMIEGPGS